jgi:gas vesicle protein
MDNRSDRFAGGFVVGTLFGGVIGGFLGVFLASKVTNVSAEDTPSTNGKTIEPKPKKRKSLQAGNGLNIEEARQGLEDKIAQLNDAIDDVRSQLSNVHTKN